MGNSCSSEQSTQYPVKEYIDDIDYSITHFAELVDTLLLRTTEILKFNNNGSTSVDEVDEIENDFEHLQQLQRQCLEDQMKVIEGKKEALQDIKNMFHLMKGISKEKKEKSNKLLKDDLKLDIYLDEPRTQLPVIHTVENCFIDKIKNRINVLTKEIMLLKTEVETKTKENEDLRKQTDDLKTEVHLLKQERKSTQLLKVDALFSDNQEKTENDRTQTRSTEKEIDPTQEDSENNADTINEKENVSLSKEEYTRLQRGNENFKKEIEEVRHELDKRNIEIESLQKEIKDLENRSKAEKMRLEKELLSMKTSTQAHTNDLLIKVDNPERKLQSSQTEAQKKKTSSHVKYEKRIECLEKELKNVREENDVLKAEKCTMNAEFQKIEERMQNEALETKGNLEKKIGDKEKTLKEKIDENLELNSRVSSLTQQIKGYETELKCQKDSEKDQKMQIEVLEKQLQEAKNETELIKQARDQVIETNKHMLEEIKDLEGSKAMIESRLKSESKNNEDLQMALEAQKKMNDSAVAELAKDIEMLRESNSDNETAMVSLRNDNQQLEQKYDAVKLVLEKLKSTKTLRIQLYHHSRVAMLSKLELDLKMLLKQEIEDELTKLVFVECGGGSDIDPNEPLLIICISASRLGTDAANAVQSLKLSPKMALLIFHHKDGHALPNQASENVLTGQMFSHLGGIFDFGFLSSRGIYSCDMNDKNLKNVVYFINQRK